MKCALIAVIVVLALTHGNVSADAATDMEKVSQIFQDLVESIKTSELTSQAKTQIDSFHAQIKPLAANMEEQLKPLAESIQAQMKPLAESIQAQIGEVFQKLMEQTKAIGQ